MSNQKKKYFLSVLTIFKNESHILEEWLNHYIKEGVEHFYLHNNNSTDDFMNIINKYNNYIDLFDAKENCEQLKHLNSQIDKIKKETEWIINVDLDEFLFAKEDYKTIYDIINILNSTNSNIGVIRIPWINFSSNNIITQPKSVIESFTDRKNYIKNPSKHNQKYIARTNLLKNILVHTAETDGIIILSNGNEYNKNKFYINTNNIEDQLLQLNHYVLQSKEWFLNVKCTRGAVNKNSINVRNINYFNKYNNEFTGYSDFNLKTKKY